MPIACEICKKVFRTITPSHLKYIHGITLAEYKKNYPRASIVSLESKIIRQKTNSSAKTHLAGGTPENAFCGGENQIPWQPG